MKILITQLARLGDIYMTWPVIRAIRRQYPTAQIDFLVRNKFQAAISGLEAVNKTFIFNTRHVLEPILMSPDRSDESLDRISGYVDQLKSEKYDAIYNFSFSPFSSYLVHAISHEKTKIKGYTRFADGYLNLPDDSSAYFYAQVGPGRSNRIHLIDIFASMAEVDLIAEDYDCKKLISEKRVTDSAYVVIHASASQKEKCFSEFKWAQVINQLHKKNADLEFVLIGASNELNVAEAIVSSVPHAKIHNLVGQTQMSDLFGIIHHAQLLIGCDSAPQHIATLVNAKCLNISFSTVNFWETGPRSPESYVIFAESEDALASDFVSQTAYQICNSAEVDASVYRFTEKIPSYTRTLSENDFCWNLVQALYLGTEFPMSEKQIVADAFVRLREVNELIQEQIENIRATRKAKEVSAIIDRGDEIVQAIANLVPDIAPLIRWYQTEKIRIGPVNLSTVMDESERVHKMLDDVLTVYLGKHSVATNEALRLLEAQILTIQKISDESAEVATWIRLNGMSEVANDFARFVDSCIAHVHALAKIRDYLNQETLSFSAERWLQLESAFEEIMVQTVHAFEDNNYNMASDLLQYEMKDNWKSWHMFLSEIKNNLQAQVEEQLIKDAASTTGIIGS